MGPDGGPGSRRRLRGDRRRDLLAGDAGLRRNLEAGEEIGVLRHIVRCPIILAIFLDARNIEAGDVILAIHGMYLLALTMLRRAQPRALKQSRQAACSSFSIPPR